MFDIRIKKDEIVKKVTFDKNKTNVIYGKNKSGKTTYLKELENGFSGRHEFFKINGVDVKTGLFNVIKIESDRDGFDELKVAKKSNIYKNVVTKITEDNYDQLEKWVDDFTEKINSVLDYRFKYELSDSAIATDHDKIEKLNTVMFKLIIDDVSESIADEFIIRQMIDNNISDEKYNVILIDNIDKSLDEIQVSKLLEYIVSIKNTTVICTTKNKYLLNHLDVDKYNCAYNTINLIDIARTDMFEYFKHKEGNQNNIDDYILQNQDYFEKKDYKKWLDDNKLHIISKIK